MSDLTSDDIEAIRQAATKARPKLMTVDPEPDEMGDLPPAFVSNGWIRMTINGESHKMRRPLLGEMQELEALLDTHRREITDRYEQMQAEIAEDMIRAREIEAEAKSLNGDAAERKAELDDEATRLGTKAMERAEELSRYAATLRGEWWRAAFKLLTPPGFNVPEQMPAWVKDAELQNRVIQHWQSVPLALGSE